MLCLQKKKTKGRIYMFDGIKNSFKHAASTGKQVSEEFSNMSKEIRKAPWKNLKPVHIAYLLIAAIIFLVMAFVVYPKLNGF